LINEHMQRLAAAPARMAARFDEAASKRALQKFVEAHKHSIAAHTYTLCQSLIKETEEK